MVNSIPATYLAWQEWQEKQAILKKLFENQIQTLKDRSLVPHWIINMLQSQKGLVLARATFFFRERKKDRIPFLPVIPFWHLSVKEQILMVQNGYRLGRTSLRPLYIFDTEWSPWWPYYIFDVDRGTNLHGKKHRGRKVLNVAEAIALCVHTGLLSHHFVAAIGSYYKSIGQSPVIFLGAEERPELDCLADYAVCDYPSLEERKEIRCNYD